MRDAGGVADHRRGAARAFLERIVDQGGDGGFAAGRQRDRVPVEDAVADDAPRIGGQHVVVESQGVLGQPAGGWRLAGGVGGGHDGPSQSPGWMPACFMTWP
ncbi:Uncharacterised protein [Bordetella pertussis]|nr:Uncharacterised protein [Bordetella pertussis]